jgi:membrane peptidoglycan carboxypeptidase
MFPFENGKGLNESANFFYGRNIDHLNAEEITSIIARLKAPLYYKKNPQELEKRVKELLKEVESSKTRARP